MKEPICAYLKAPGFGKPGGLAACQRGGAGHLLVGKPSSSRCAAWTSRQSHTHILTFLLSACWVQFSSSAPQPCRDIHPCPCPLKQWLDSLTAIRRRYNERYAASQPRPWWMLGGIPPVRRTSVNPGQHEHECCHACT
eukprot:368383-Pelagomonas_calceolata.AAC.3